MTKERDDKEWDVYLAAYANASMVAEIRFSMPSSSARPTAGVADQASTLANECAIRT